MRLIDADALKTERGMADRCENCKHDARMCQFNQDYTRMDICGMLDDAPTIDAIPVEWLCKYRAGLTNVWDLDVSAINNILCQWKKEHGTANSDKNGVWESLGHRIGLCKHPWSEDFRCSLCGYEAYTVFYTPPERCPVCDAKMSIKQEAR